MLFNSGAISWSTRYQELITLLTIESKYIIATHTSKKALWLYLFISEIFGKKLEATILFSNNQFMITLTQDCQFHIHTKHINICYHFICWTIKEDKIHLVYCSIKNMITNTFIKTLSSLKVKHFVVELGLSTWILVIFSFIYIY